MFLDTANVNEINECLNSNVFRGVTTNPTLLLKEKVERFTQINKILNTETKMLFVQILGSTVDELYADYKKIKAIKTNKKIAYKVPINFIGLEAVKKIKTDDPDNIVLGTAIYSADQGILAALAGCDCIAPYVNRMENNNINPYEEISNIRAFYDDRNIKCEIVAASFKNTTQIVNALNAGAHTCTISPELFNKMINKELAVNAIKVFNNDGYKLDDITK